VDYVQSAPPPRLSRKRTPTWSGERLLRPKLAWGGSGSSKRQTRKTDEEERVTHRGNVNSRKRWKSGGRHITGTLQKVSPI